MEALWRDFALSMRALRRSPIFTIAAVLTLALGVAANVAVFSVVNALLLRPLPVRDSDRLVVLATKDPSGPALRGVSFPDLQDYRAATPDVFEDVAAYSVGFVGLTVDGHRPARVLATWVTGNYFPLLGLEASRGRLIATLDAHPGPSHPVVVLGYTTSGTPIRQRPGRGGHRRQGERQALHRRGRGAGGIPRYVRLFRFGAVPQVELARR